MYQKKQTIASPDNQNKKIDLQFSAGKLTSNAGVILLQQVDQQLNLINRISNTIADPRDPIYITHLQQHLLAQRLFAITLGYEDLNDHDDLRNDPALLAIIKNLTDEKKPLASDSTLSRLENRITKTELAKLSRLPLEFFIESFDTPPEEIIIDLDATDDPTHGNQEGSFFNAFYDEYCFLPLYFFCGDQLLWSQLRPCNRSGSHGTLAILHIIRKRLLEVWPNTKIILRGDAGFYAPKLLDYCDKYQIDYILGFSSNSVLKEKTKNLVLATKLYFKDAGSQESFRMFDEIVDYKACTWNNVRKIIVKSERLPDGTNLDGKENTRFIVTSISGDPQDLYENVYCKRGDMENRIKEQQLMLFADRTSCHDFDANRFRLLLSGFAYILFDTMRRTALYGTDLAKAQCSTIRTKLLKVGALITESVRRILFALPSSYPLQELWFLVLRRLSCRAELNTS